MPAAAFLLVAPVATRAVGPKPAVLGTITLTAGRDPSAREVAWPTTVLARLTVIISLGPNPVPRTDTGPPGAAKARERLKVGPLGSGLTKNSSSAAGTVAGPFTETA